MARKTKASGQDSDPKGPVIIEDMVDVPAEDAVAENATDINEATDDARLDAEPDTAQDADSESPQDVPDHDPELDVDADNDTDPEPEPEPMAEKAEPVEALPPALAPQQVTVQKVGFVPLVLGGAIAAAFGFGVAWLALAERDNDMAALVAEQSARIDALTDQVAALPTEKPDLAPLEGRIAAAEEALGTMSGDVTAQIAAFDERLTGVERAPGVDGTLAETAIASWERELATLREEIAAQQARMSDIATTAEADLEASRAEAEAVEAQAEQAANDAIARAALARVQVALDAGTPFEVPLADLVEAGVEPPEVLTAAAAEGVPTIAILRETFPDAARAALAAARAEGLADVDTNPVTAFLRNQFDVRSVQPREGDDPDAILSRVNAALADNRLTDALAEIEGLPEVARTAMSDWIAQAEARTAAAAAVETLDQPSNN